MATSRADWDLARALIDRGADVNGLPPLQIPLLNAVRLCGAKKLEVRRPALELIRLLLSKPINLNAADP